MDFVFGIFDDLTHLTKQVLFLFFTTNKIFSFTHKFRQIFTFIINFVGTIIFVIAIVVAIIRFVITVIVVDKTIVIIIRIVFTFIVTFTVEDTFSWYKNNNKSYKILSLNVKKHRTFETGFLLILAIKNENISGANKVSCINQVTVFRCYPLDPRKKFLI